MNKAELVTAVAEQADVSKKAAEGCVNAFMDIVKSEVAHGNSVQLIGFGTFEKGERAAREGRNPQTGAAISIPAQSVPKFKAGKAFKEAVNA